MKTSLSDYSNVVNFRRRAVCLDISEEHHQVPHGKRLEKLEMMFNREINN